MIHEVAEIVADHRYVVVELPVFAPWRSPACPTVRFFQDEIVFFAVQPSFVGPVFFKAIEVFQEQEPRCLFSVVELGGAAGFFPEHVVDIFEGLFEHKTAPRHTGIGAYV